MRQDRRPVPGKLAELRPRRLVLVPLRRAARVPLLRVFIADPEGLRRGMIYLMARTDAGFSYPGYVIYISAIYTFWSVGTAIYGYVKAAWKGKSGNDDPTGVSLKALNAARAAVSVLGLQTAMLTSFAGGDDEYARMMNTITGGFVFAAVIFIAAHTMKKAGKE